MLVHDSLVNHSSRQSWAHGRETCSHVTRWNIQEVPGTSQDFHDLGPHECSHLTRGDIYDLELQECSYVTRGDIQDFHDLGVQEGSCVTRGDIPGLP